MDGRWLEVILLMVMMGDGDNGDNGDGDGDNGDDGDDGDVNFHIKFLRRRCAWDGRWPEFGVHGWRLVDARREGVTCGLVPMLGGHL